MAITIQSTYDIAPSPSGPGVIDSGDARSIVSRTTDAAGIAFGHACFAISADRISAIAAGASGTETGKFLGVAVADAGIVADRFTPPDIYPGNSGDGAFETVSVLIKGGPIWVIAGSNTARDATAYVTPAGAFTTASGGNQATGGTFRDAVASGSLVRLRLAGTV
jgi:hypothetical protein